MLERSGKGRKHLRPETFPSNKGGEKIKNWLCMTYKKVVDKLHELIIVSSCTQERGAKTSRQKNADERSRSRRCGRGLERAETQC